MCPTDKSLVINTIHKDTISKTDFDSYPDIKIYPGPEIQNAVYNYLNVVRIPPKFLLMIATDFMTSDKKKLSK